jgi:hypothetical protein
MKKRSPQPPREFSYSGNLQQNPLPELLCKIGQYKVPGVITVTHRQLSRQIFIHDGVIIFATSNSQEDHLGEFLFRFGKISRRDLDHSIEQLQKRKGRRQGEILVGMKALPGQELAWAIRAHQQAIVWSLFNWFEGDLTFNIGTYKEQEAIKLDLTIPRAILDGVRNIHQAKRIVAYMGSRNTVFEAQEDSLLSIEAIGADEKEREILKSVDGKTILYDLCDHSPYGAHETARILYGLYILKLIRKKTEGIRIVSSLPSSNF